jgi:hypothetical protein
MICIYRYPGFVLSGTRVLALLPGHGFMCGGLEERMAVAARVGANFLGVDGPIGWYSS